MTDALPRRDEWQATFEANWLKHFQDTGETNWKVYNYAKPENDISGQAIDLKQSTIMLISTSGAYLKDEQTAFDAANLEGDYSIRTFAKDTAFDALDYAHDHYDQTAVRQDAQVLLPLQHLQQLADNGEIGGFADTIVSYSGYHPNVGQVLDETLPAIQAMVRDVKPDAVLLVPS